MLESTSVQYEYVWPGVANSLGCFLLFEHEPEACRRDAVSKTDVLDRCKSCREDVSGVQRGVLNTSGMKKIVEKVREVPRDVGDSWFALQATERMAGASSFSVFALWDCLLNQIGCSQQKVQNPFYEVSGQPLTLFRALECSQAWCCCLQCIGWRWWSSVPADL